MSWCGIKKGHLIKDLKAEEIGVTDDGASQKILSFRLRTGAELSADEAPGTTATPGTKPGGSEIEPFSRGAAGHARLRPARL